MSKNCFTYLIIISLTVFWSCSAPDTSSNEKGENSALAEDGSGDSENAVYAEAYEEAATEEMEVEEGYEYSKDVSEEESYVAITTDQLAALQGRADQKVNELFEYITIMSNVEYDLELRQNAQKMAINLFNEEARIYAPSITDDQEPLMVSDVLKDILDERTKLTGMSVSSVEVIKEDGEDYVYCELLVSGDVIKLLFDVSMEYETKQFGYESQQVWTVYLRDIEEL